MLLPGSKKGVVLVAAVLFAALLLSGCRSVAPVAAADASPRRVWPQPPAAARIAYVGALHRPADVGARPGLWRRIWRTIAGTGSRDRAFVRPSGICKGEGAALFVADPGAGAVFHCDPEAHVFQRWTRLGDTAFVSPVALAWHDGCLYVADSALGAVFGMNLRGEKVLELRAPLLRPAGIAAVDGRLIVSDAAAHCLYVIGLDGTVQRKIGGRGAAPGAFNFPTHIGAGPDGRFCVTDSMNFRIQIFDRQGRFLSAVGSAGDSSGQFSRPRGADFDPDGRLYAVDALFDNLQIFDAQGRFLLAVGEAGAAPGEFWLPAGLAIDGEGRIYVADSYNRRVQILERLEVP